MKRTLALILAAFLLISLVPGLAQTGQLPPEAARLNPVDKLEAELVQGPDQTRSLPLSNDTVVIQNGAFTITSKGVTVTLQAPFGWYAFSQDIKQQLNDYMRVFKDPRSAMEFVINSDLSLFAMDLETSDQIVYYLRESEASLFFRDLQETGVNELAVSYFTENAPEGNQVSELAINGRPFIRSLEIKSSGVPTLVYFTFVSGVMLGFQLDPGDGEVSEADDAILLAFVEGVEFHESAPQ